MDARRLGLVAVALTVFVVGSRFAWVWGIRLSAPGFSSSRLELWGDGLAANVFFVVATALIAVLGAFGVWWSLRRDGRWQWAAAVVLGCFVASWLAHAGNIRLSELMFLRGSGSTGASIFRLDGSPLDEAPAWDYVLGRSWPGVVFNSVMAPVLGWWMHRDGWGIPERSAAKSDVLDESDLEPSVEFEAAVPFDRHRR